MKDVAKKQSAWSFGPITDDNIDQAIKTISTGWYSVAVLQGLLLTFLVVMQAFPSGDLIDPFAAAFGGYFIRSRKSRALAVALFLYSLAVLAITVAAKLGMAQGGTNIILALVVVYIGWRGIPATWFYQRRRCADIQWGRTVLISLATALTGFVGIIAAAIIIGIAEGMGKPIPASYTGLLYAALVFFPTVLTIALLTRKWPLARPDDACPWPPKQAVPLTAAPK